MSEETLPDFIFSVRAESPKREAGSPKKRKAAAPMITFSRRKRLRQEDVTSQEQRSDGSQDSLLPPQQPCAPAAAQLPRGVDEQGAANQEPKAKPLTQLHLDFGQATFNLKRCKACGMMFTVGLESDEQLHAAFHSQSLKGVRFQGWSSEREVAMGRNGYRILMILPGDPPAHQKKVKEVGEVVTRQLGMPDDWLLREWLTAPKPTKIFLAVSRHKRVVGFLVVEQISQAFPILPSGAQEEKSWSPLALKILATSPPAVPPSKPLPPHQQPEPSTSSVAASRLPSPPPCSALRSGQESSSAPAWQPQTSAGGGRNTTAGASHIQPESKPQPLPLALATAPTAVPTCPVPKQEGRAKGTLLTRWLSSNGVQAGGKHATGNPAPSASPATPAPAHQQEAAIFTRADPSSTIAATSSKRSPQPHSPASPQLEGQTLSSAELVCRDDPIDEARSAGDGGEEVLMSSSSTCRQPQPGNPPAESNSCQGGALAVDKSRAQAAECGVRAIWVSVEARRQGIATHLLDTARRHFSPSWLPREQMAFSQPTSEGARLATAFTRRPDFLVYLESQ